MSEFEIFVIIVSLGIKLECIQSILHFYPLDREILTYKV